MFELLRQGYQPDTLVLSPTTMDELQRRMQPSYTTEATPTFMGMAIKVSRHQPEGKVAVMQRGELVAIIDVGSLPPPGQLCATAATD